MKHQLIAGTYCKFDTAAECKAAFDRAKELNIPMDKDFDGDETVLYFDGDILMAMWYATTEKEIPVAEFLSRMEGNWEKPQLTLPEAIAKLEAQGFKVSKFKFVNRVSNRYFVISKGEKGWEITTKMGVLESDKHNDYKQSFEEAIEACETLNNAK